MEEEKKKMRGLCAAFLIGILLAGIPGQTLAASGNDTNSSGNISKATNDTEKNVAKPAPHASDCPSEDACELWEEFKEEYGDAFTSVGWDSACGCVRSLYGYYDTGLGELVTEEEAEAFARYFLSENADLFKIDMAQLKFKETKGSVAIYEQYYLDIPVYNGGLRVVLNNWNGSSYLSGIGNNFHPDINISTEPEITREEEAEIAIQDIGLNFDYDEIANIINYTLPYIVPKTENGDINYYLTWAVPTSTHVTLYFIDAKDGSVVHKVVTPATGSTVPGGSIINALPSLKYPVGVILLLALILMWRRKRRK